MLPLTSKRSECSPAGDTWISSSEPICGGAPWNVTSTRCAPRCRISARVPSSTNLPLLRIPTRPQSASTSLRMCEERNTVCPRSFASCTLSRKATSISGSRPLVGSSR